MVNPTPSGHFLVAILARVPQRAFSRCNVAIKREQSNVFELPSVSSIAFSNAKIIKKIVICKYFPQISTINFKC